MPNYDSAQFDPPAPVALVTLRNPENHLIWDSVPMLLDTGADISLVPAECVSRLAISIEGCKSYAVAGFDGTQRLAHGVHLDLTFIGRTFRGRFLLMEDRIGILGRDILNYSTL